MLLFFIATTKMVVGKLWKYFLTGLIIVLPLALTFFFVRLGLAVMTALFGPVVSLIDLSSYVGSQPPIVHTIATVALFCGTLIVIGIVFNSTKWGRIIQNYFHGLIESLPIVGGIYSGFRRISESTTKKESFSDVKLVQFPTENSYTLAFVTADTPESFNKAVNEENMETLFMPLGPNPITGGFVISVPEDKIYEVDISVEEALQATITSGLTLEEEK